MYVLNTFLFAHIWIRFSFWIFSYIAIVHNLMECSGKKNTMIAAKHFEQAIQYNIPHGKKIRGLSAVSAYKKLIGESNGLTAKNKEMANLLGWCIEMVSWKYSKVKPNKERYWTDGIIRHLIMMMMLVCSFATVTIMRSIELNSHKI